MKFSFFFHQQTFKKVENNIKTYNKVTHQDIFLGIPLINCSIRLQEFGLPQTEDYSLNHMYNLSLSQNPFFNFLQYVEEKLSRRILEQAKKQQDELEAEFGVASGSRKSLKKAQTLLTPPELQGLDAEEIESDNDDDAASVASEQFYENIVCIMYQSI